MDLADEYEEYLGFYLRDPETGAERVNWGLLFRDPVCEPARSGLLLFLRLLYMQVDLWLKKWRRR